MTYNTHKYSGVTSVLICYPYFLSCINKVEYHLENRIMYGILGLIVLLWSTYWGTILPDLDSNSPVSIPKKNMITLSINKFLKMIGARHRTWHTHSIDLYIIIFGVPMYACYLRFTSTLNPLYALTSTLLMGFGVSCIFHVILDCFTVTGSYISIVWLFIYHKILRGNKKPFGRIVSHSRITFVPRDFKYIGFTMKGIIPVPTVKQPFKNATAGSDYEVWFRQKFIKLNYVLLVVVVLVFFKVEIFNVVNKVENISVHSEKKVIDIINKP